MGRVKALNKPYNNYVVDEVGNVMNKSTGRFLKPHKDKDGYLIYVLSNNGVTMHFPAHRLVAIYFVDNPNNYKIVDHKDTNRINNFYLNLRWCTVKENANNPITRANISNSKKGSKNPNYNKSGEDIVNAKKVFCYDLKMKFIKKYHSISEAARDLQISQSHASNIFNNKVKGNVILKSV